MPSSDQPKPGPGPADEDIHCVQAVEITRLYRQHGAALRRHARRYLRSDLDAEDVIQEVFVRLCRLEDLNSLTSPSAVLFKTASRLALNEIRRRRSCVLAAAGELDGDRLESDLADPERAAGARETLATYCRLLDQLPPQCRRVVALRKLHGWSFKEIGDKMGLSVSTVEKHMRRGNLLLANAIAFPEEVTVAGG